MPCCSSLTGTEPSSGLHARNASTSSKDPSWFTLHGVRRLLQPSASAQCGHSTQHRGSDHTGRERRGRPPAHRRADRRLRCWCWWPMLMVCSGNAGCGGLLASIKPCYTVRRLPAETGTRRGVCGGADAGCRAGCLPAQLGITGPLQVCSEAQRLCARSRQSMRSQYGATRSRSGYHPTMSPPNARAILTIQTARTCNSSQQISCRHALAFVALDGVQCKQRQSAPTRSVRLKQRSSYMRLCRPSASRSGQWNRLRQ